MGAMKELLALRGSLEAASAIVTHAFADPWTAKNRPQPWELVQDTNKHVTAPVAKTLAMQGQDHDGSKKEYWQRRQRKTVQGWDQTEPAQWEKDQKALEERLALEAAGGGSNGT
jgi:hypothetical protein